MLRFNIFYTAKKTTELMQTLRLYNLTYMQATICNKLFPAQTQAKHKVYGCYFHSIICHAPTYYRLISLRSLNTEYQERIFKQGNAITNSTSNMHPELGFKCTGQYLNGKALQSVTAAYNKWFESYGQMQTTQVVASKIFLLVSKAFLQR